MPVHSKRKAQIKAQIGALVFEKAFTKILAEYSNYNNVFSLKNAIKHLVHTGINKHAIKLEEDKQPLFVPIYNLGPRELETWKTYIEINLTNGFIWPSKSPARAFILFDKKLDKNLYFYIDYWDLNNLIIKNQYLLYLINKLLDWLS